ncbi:glycosyltransferase [uncultured Ilumatobacter sp.]|uniref:glycosyltransferase n=1 Tax=uncultured Ilumatobacter sp. TaxID=879968 RepID=UPI00374FD0F0
MQLVPSVIDVSIYLAGWTIGWLLLWRPRPIPAAGSGDVRRAIAVVIPARDEAAALPYLIPPLVAQLRTGDQLMVVNDHSTDGTGDVAASLGATVVVPPALPTGWLGKPHACSIGAGATTAPHLLFLDADVRPAPDLLDRVGTELAAHPDSVVSVQPWHATGRWTEQASILSNITALMGCGAFTAAGNRVTATVAFGPVLAVDRSTYDAAGGHAHPDVRAMHTEDIGLARRVGRSRLFTGAPDTSFRMYPDGLTQTIRGWTRSIATGARFTRWWLTLATLLWVWSLAGGWLASPLLYPLSALQVWVLGRRAASVHPLTALLFPIAVAAFVVIFVRSLFAVVFGRQVAWKGRTVAAR